MVASVEIIESKLFSGAVADEILATIGEAVSERGRASLVLAGGTTPGAIYRLLGHPPRVAEVPWEKVDLFWGDERWVSPEDNMSNYHMVKGTFLDNLGAKGPAVHEVKFGVGSPEKAAAAYEAEIRRTLGVRADAIPVFDLVLLGIGEDGHTASIFPHSPLFSAQNPHALAAAVPHPTGAVRVTLTAPALFSAKKILFIVTGDNKADIVREVIEGTEDPTVYPARLAVAAGDRVTWFLDSGAAKKLTPREG